MEHASRQWFWMNGEQLDIDTMELFTFIRELPEPIPLEMVAWNSMTSSLASSNSQWSALLIKELYLVMAKVYEHHELVARDRSLSLGKRALLCDEIALVGKHMKSLWKIVAVAEKAPLSVWATAQNKLEEASVRYDMNGQSWFSSVLELPHIGLPLLWAEREHSALKSDVIKWQSTYELFVKRNKRTSARRK